MKVEKYRKLREQLIGDAFKVSNAKGEDYTQKSDDALKNFKSVAQDMGLTPYQTLGVYMKKHQDAISSFIKHGGQLESEPIKERIIDNINYLCLLWGLITEEDELLEQIYPNNENKTVEQLLTPEGMKRFNGRKQSQEKFEHDFNVKNLS